MHGKLLAFLIPVSLFILPLLADSAEKNPDDNYTVLKISYYDARVVHEVHQIKELALRIQEVWAEFPIWQEAHRQATRKWNEWYRERTPENQGRAWVLPKPTQPRFEKVGTFTDEIAAEDKAAELRKAHQARIDQYSKDLYRNRTQSWPQMMKLNNMFANAKLVRELIPLVRDEIIDKDRKAAMRLPESKRKEIWDLVHKAEAEAKRIATEASKDKDGNPTEPDVIEVYNLSRKLIDPILSRYRITEWQWFAIWEEGYLNKWVVPGQQKDPGNPPPADPKEERRKRNRERRKKKK